MEEVFFLCVIVWIIIRLYSLNFFHFIILEVPVSVMNWVEKFSNDDTNILNRWKNYNFFLFFTFIFRDLIFVTINTAFCILHTFLHVCFVFIWNAIKEVVRLHVWYVFNIPLGISLRMYCCNVVIHLDFIVRICVEYIPLTYTYLPTYLPTQTHEYVYLLTLHRL